MAPFQAAGTPGEALSKEIEAFARDPLVKRSPEGLNRLRSIGTRFEALSPADAYRLLDPPEFEREVTETHLRGLNWLVTLRNICSILPLIFTWYALFRASSAFSRDPQAFTPPPGATAPSSFFVLWEQGFGGRDWTFTQAAIIDVGLLLSFLLATLAVQLYENYGQQQGYKFANKLQGLTTSLIGVIADSRLKPLDPNSPIHSLADAVNRASKDLIDASDRMVKESQATLGRLEKQMQTAVTALAAKVDAVETQLGKMGANNTQLANAGIQLANSADTLRGVADTIGNTGLAIQRQISSLDETEKKLVGELKGVTDEVRKASTGMETATQKTTELTGQLKDTVRITTTTLTQSAQQMGQVIATTAKDIGTTVGNAATYISNAAGVLNTTQNGLGHAANAIETAGDRIESAAIFMDRAVRNGGLGGSGGFNLWDRLMRRGRRQRQNNNQPPPAQFFPPQGYQPPMGGHP
jgi:hypothetical protein